MIVTPDRYACVQYKEELDKHFDELQVRSSYPPAPTMIASEAKQVIDKSQQEKLVGRV
ncbi:hypothetical protein O9929_17065 [Vibrio lentus]|nr:hypothetical protein [Vibrio lentus]